jgi:lipid-A-disaccharide synthase
MGFWEVLLNMRTILKNIKFCKQDLLRYEPDALILVDYPGFNLRIAKYAHQMGLRVFYYISPQLWAWKESRVHLIKRVVDRMFVILPFEKEFYARFNYKVDFVGHPLLDELKNELGERKSLDEESHEKEGKQVVALLPGSREQEVKRMLPVMVEASTAFPDCEFVVAGTTSVNVDAYGCCGGRENINIQFDQTYGILKRADAAMVTSGTATLETALFGVPEVVCYKGSLFSYLIARKLVKTKYISLVNLVMDRIVVKELIQGECNSENLKQILKGLLQDEGTRSKMKADYKELKEKLGGKGASENTARLLLKYLSA